MKQFRYILFLLLPAFVLTFAVAWDFVLDSKVEEARSTLADNLGGHAWDTYYGWISYNNCNDDYSGFIGQVDSNNCWLTSDYGLDMTVTTNPGTGEVTGGSIQGFMWHDNLGWICVGASCSSYTSACGSDTSPPSGSMSVTFGAPDANDWAELNGWGKVCAWGDVSGDAEWISFNCDNDPDCSGNRYGVYVNVEDFTMGSPVGEPGCLNCGFAWNGYSTGGGDTELGIGYIQFDPSLSSGHGIYFRTEGGDIYAYRNISPATDINDINSTVFNATYLIAANGTVENFTSEELDKSPSMDEGYIRDDIDIGGILKEDVPGTGEFYYNALGFLDIQGIEAGEYGDIYGSGPMPDENASDAGIEDDFLLDGEVYVREGDFYIDSDIDFRVGTGSHSGAGTFLIKGDLYIDNDIAYRTSNANRLINVPSVAFIVLGDVYIDPDIEELVGNYFVLGNGTTCPASFLAEPGGCGRFGTGESEDTYFELRGMVMARQFNLQRLYTDVVNRPSELFTFDGRLIANPPPGFEDLSSNFPLIFENTPF